MAKGGGLATVVRLNRSKATINLRPFAGRPASDATEIRADHGISLPTEDCTPILACAGCLSAPDPG